MSLLTSYLALIGLLNWVGIALLITVDAHDRGLGSYWKWGLLSLFSGMFGFAAYVLFAVSPTDQ